MTTIEVKVSCMACRKGKCTNEDCEGFKTVKFPAVFQVCHDCKGHGTVLNPSMRKHAYTQEEFARDFDDEERAEYFKRGGRYDVICPTCKGKNVVLAIDCERVDKQQLAAYFESVNIRVREEREEAAIRLMESGGGY